MNRQPQAEQAAPEQGALPGPHLWCRGAGWQVGAVPVHVPHQANPHADNPPTTLGARQAEVCVVTRRAGFRGAQCEACAALQTAGWEAPGVAAWARGAWVAQQCLLSPELSNGVAEAVAAQLHLGVTCDVSGVSPICGVRYTRRSPSSNQSYDICQHVYETLDSAEQQTFAAMPVPDLQLVVWSLQDNSGGVDGPVGLDSASDYDDDEQDDDDYDTGSSVSSNDGRSSMADAVDFKVASTMQTADAAACMEKYRDATKCSICFQHYSGTQKRRLPQNLTCGHSFCLACINRMVKPLPWENEDGAKVKRCHGIWYCGRQRQQQQRQEEGREQPTRCSTAGQCAACARINAAAATARHSSTDTCSNTRVGRQKSVPCPICREMTTVPEGRAEKLPKNFALLSMID